jgi:AcrR family transcriptional regulator
MKQGFDTQDGQVAATPGASQWQLLRTVSVEGNGKTEQARAGATRAALVKAARELFGKAGYHATGTNEVVALAQVTRGALYHHFGSKEVLFEAVWREVARDISAQAVAATRAMSGQTWPRVIAAVRTYFGLVATNREIQRILLLDGPAVFGWEHWRELQVECRLPGWVETLDLMAAKGLIEDQPREPLAHLILAVLDDAALTVAHATKPETALKEVMGAVEALLGGLRKPGS